MQERLNWQHWKCCEPQKGSVGSNPTLSAIAKKDKGGVDLNSTCLLYPFKKMASDLTATQAEIATVARFLA